MNQGKPYPPHPGAVLQSFWRHRFLIWQLGRRQVLSRYRGSMLGLAWSVAQPLIMLGIYTFVFGVVFKLRFGVDAPHVGEISFPEVLFAGLIVHGLLAEILIQSPRLILSNVNFVKRVIFPLEILSWAAMVAALFNVGISSLVLLVFYLALHQSLPWTIGFIPIVLLPLAVLCMGVSWVFAAIGAYLRDVGEVVGVLSTLLLFGSPVFYPTSAIPERFRMLLYANPLTFVIEQVRDVALFGRMPNWIALGAYLAGAIVIAWLGLLFFLRARRGFADVL